MAGRHVVQFAVSGGANPSEADFSYAFGEVVPDWNTMDKIQMHNVTVKGIVPDTPCKPCVMRVLYISNNSVSVLSLHTNGLIGPQAGCCTDSLI
jgi:hypothetical protein